MEVPVGKDECAIVGIGVAQATLEEIARLRKDPGPGRPATLEFQVLKHADEHTVLALSAMLKGLAGFPPEAHFRDWGVVAAPRWPGRLAIAGSLEKYHSDGARGVSPLLIPNLCLHSLSGTVSLAFRMRGPNFGVGGGLASVPDGLLAGLNVQLEHRPPGTWVLFTEWDLEPGQIGAQQTPRASALALALGPVAETPSARRLLLRPTSAPPKAPAYPRLAGLVDFLSRPFSGQASWSCALDWGMELALTQGESKT
jgi:hypothetical protein